MSEQERNVEALRRGFEQFNRTGVEGILPLIDPEFEGVVSPDLTIEPDTYRGREGVLRYFAAFEGAMEDVGFDPDQFAATGDKVFLRMRLRARGAGTGIEVTQIAYQVWTMRDGKAVGVVAYADRAEALEAAGIEQ